MFIPHIKGLLVLQVPVQIETWVCYISEISSSIIIGLVILFTVLSRVCHRFRINPNLSASIFCDYYRLVLKTGTMGKFKVLEYNQNYMARIGIHSHHLNESTNEFFKSFVSYYYLFVFSVIFITASAVNVYQSWPQMDIISEPCLIVIAGLQVTGMYLAVGLKMKKVKNLHIELQGIVDEGIICFSNEKCLQFDKLFIISKIKNMMCSTFIGKLSENVEDIRN